MSSDSPTLGTAQWSHGYGITNATARISDEEIGRMMAVALEGGVTRVDTAAAYGDAHHRLRPWTPCLHITTKVAGARPERVIDLVRDALTSLGTSQVETVLLHDWEALTLHLDAARALERVRELGLCSRVGVSLYSTEGLNRALECFEALDVAQVPANVLDRRFGVLCTSRSLDAGPTSFQIRSVLLQGLLSERSDSSPGRHSDVVRFHQAAHRRGRRPIEIALAHAKAMSWASEVIIGATSASELKEILAIWSQVTPQVAPVHLESEDLDLIDPRRWKNE